MYFRQPTIVVALVLCVVVGGAMAIGVLVGRRLAARPDPQREPVGVVQGAMLGLIGLLLAFGLSMAVGRYEVRRGLLVDEANAIGTTYLRAQLLSEPARSDTLELLERYADDSIALADSVPGSDEFDAAVLDVGATQRLLWADAALAVQTDPTGTAPRLYVESLNEMFDATTSRVAALRNRVPNAVMLLQILTSGAALGILALYITMLGRSTVPSVFAGAVVILILFISFDLDRPHRGVIQIPFGPLEDVRASMDEPAAAAPP
jgi:hypothetical protein